MTEHEIKERVWALFTFCKDWIKSQLSFDIMLGEHWFLFFDINPFNWFVGFHHGESSIEFSFGPFSLTKQWEKENDQ